jgi:hypothetical protein
VGSKTLLFASSSLTVCRPLHLGLVLAYQIPWPLSAFITMI